METPAVSDRYPAIEVQGYDEFAVAAAAAARLGAARA